MTESIPYGRHSIAESDISEVVSVLRGDWLTTGPAVEVFEEDLSKIVGGTAVAAVNSGTAALHCAYAAQGVGPGDEVLTTPLTFAATATTALHLGATVSFADVTDDTLNLDPPAVAAAISTKTRVVSAVDFTGHPADMDALRAVAARSQTTLLEDAAHSLGAIYKGAPVGTLADVTTFSFHPVKLITTAEGGAVASPDRDLVARVKRFRDHGIARTDGGFVMASEGAWHQEVQSLGLNYRMPDLLAALGSSQLRRFGSFLTRRRQIAKRYDEALDLPGLRLPTVRDRVEPAWHLYVIRVHEGRRCALFDHLRSRGIGVQVHYMPVHLHPLFTDLGFKKGQFPVAERAYEELISLPMYPDLTDQQQDRVIDEIRSFLGS